MGFLHGLLTASSKQILFNCLCDFAKNVRFYDSLDLGENITKKMTFSRRKPLFLKNN